MSAAVLPADAKAVLRFVAERMQRRHAPFARRNDRHAQLKRQRWRTTPYTEPGAYLWEILAGLYGQRLNPVMYRYARQLARRRRLATSDTTKGGAYRAGRGQALRFELSQRHGLFLGATKLASERMDAALTVLQKLGFLVVDRPAAFLTREGVQTARAAAPEGT